MTDKPEHKCDGCGHSADSKFALKKHKRVCDQSYDTRPNMISDTYAVSSRETRYHRFVR